MKKIVCVVLLLTIIFSGCGNKSNEIKEMDVEELISIYKPYAEKMADNIKYATSDEMSDINTLSKMMYDSAVDMGIKTNQRIKVRALVEQVLEGYIYITSDEYLEKSDFTHMISCQFTVENFKKLKVGEAVVLTGILFEYKDNDDGTITFSPGLSQCDIESPNLNNR